MSLSLVVQDQMLQYRLPDGLFPTMLCAEVLLGQQLHPGYVLSSFPYPLQTLTFEGGATAIPGGDAASQDTLYGAPVEVAVYPDVHVDPFQPSEEDEPLSCCLCDGVGVVSTGQVLADMNPEEPEAADSLHRSPIDREGGVSVASCSPQSAPLVFCC